MRILYLIVFIELFLISGAQAAEAGKPHDMSAMWKSSLAKEQLSTGAVFDAQGVLWLAQVRDGHVWVSRSADLGKTFSAPVKVNAQAEAVSANGETRPKIIVAANGNIYLSWTQSLEVPFTGNVRFSRSTDGGKTFSAPITVNDDLQPITHRFEAMSVNAKGQIHLAWLDKRDAQAFQNSSARSKGEKFGGISVYAAVSDDEGKSFKANYKVADHTCECCRVAMTVDQSDTPLIAWRHIFGKNVRDHALARLDGTTHADENTVQRVTFDDWQVEACPHHGPALSASGDTLHMTWFNHGNVRSGAFYAFSKDGGKTFSEPLALGNAARQPGHATVLGTGKQVYVAWKEFDGEATAIQVMHSPDDGKTWGQVVKIAETRDQSDHPMLITNKGQVYLSWSSKMEGYRLLVLQGAAR